MSDSDDESTSMETTRMYKDDLELSRMSLYLSSQDLINNSPEVARHIRVLIFILLYIINYNTYICRICYNLFLLFSVTV